MNFINILRVGKRHILPFHLLLVSLSFFVIFCQTPQSGQSDLLGNCIRTFEDEAKCREMLGVESHTEAPVLLEGQSVRLYDRDFLENILKGKNRLYVVRLLDEPESKRRKGSGETWLYKRSVSMDRKSKKPDKGLRLYFRNGYVTRIKIKN